MGAGNVKLVFARWGDLPGNAFRALIFMAVTSMDEDDPPLFWGGRESLAVALGRTVPDSDLDDDESRLEREATFKAVKRTVQDLAKAGAITTVNVARPGRNAVYALNLSRKTGDENRPPTGDGNCPERGTETVRSGDGNCPPEEEKEDGGHNKDEMADLRNAREGIARPGARDEKDSSIAARRLGPTCTCGAELDPDGTCFMCRVPMTKRK